MAVRRIDERGFHIVLLVMVFVVVGVLGFAGWKVFSNKHRDDVKSVHDGSSQKAAEGQGSADVVWVGSGDGGWVPQGGTPPACKSKPQFRMPLDLTKVESVLYPGQQRSTGYKTHGGFTLNVPARAAVDITIPVDSHLVKASRYIEMGEVQYFMLFTLPCGYAYRFDHLRTLTPKFQAIMDKLPAAKVDDSRTTFIQPPVPMKQGEEVATGIGFSKGRSAGMDFGIYDVRQPNQASKDPAYASKHAQEKEFAFYGVCFFDYFSHDTARALRALPATDAASGKQSDYCK